MNNSFLHGLMSFPNINGPSDDSVMNIEKNGKNTVDKDVQVDFNSLNWLKVRKSRFKEGFLFTNDYGNWLFLDGGEYKQILFGNISSGLFKKLEENMMILTGNTEQKISERINDFYWYLNKGTTLHIVIPTLRCNFTCKYCYALRAPEDAFDRDMTPENMDKTIDFILDGPAGSVVIEFSGGEPLIRFDLLKRAILRAEDVAIRKNKEVFFSLISNGSLLTDEIIDFFYKHKVGICLSLDGPKGLHDSNRKLTASLGGNSNTYDLVAEKFALLKKHNYPGINALPVIVRDSLPLWKEIVDEYVKFGIKNLRFKYISNFGFASSRWNEMSYSPDEYLRSWKKVIDYMIELNKAGVEIAENVATIILKKILLKENPGYAELQIPCGAVIGQTVYDYSGSIYTCDEARTMPDFKIGTVGDSKYKDLLEHPVAKSMLSVSNLTGSCDECTWFSFCGICPLEIYNKEKGFITNIPSNYRCKIHKGMFEYLFEKIIFDAEAKKILEKWVNIEIQAKADNCSRWNSC